MSGNATAWEKFKAEVEFAFTGTGRQVSKGRYGMERNYAFGAGPKNSNVTRHVRWQNLGKYPNLPVGIVRGLSPKEKYKLKGKTAKDVNIELRDQNGEKIGDWQSEHANRSGDVDPNEEFEQDVPKGTTGVVVTLNPPFFYDRNGAMQINGTGPWLSSKARLGSVKSSRIFSKKLIKIKAQSVHTKWTGGRLFN